LSGSIFEGMLGRTNGKWLNGVNFEDMTEDLKEKTHFQIQKRLDKRVTTRKGEGGGDLVT